MDGQTDHFRSPAERGHIYIVIPPLLNRYRINIVSIAMLTISKNKYILDMNCCKDSTVYMVSWTLLLVRQHIFNLPQDETVILGTLNCKIVV